MAEAVVEDSMSGFFCHKCMLPIAQVLPEFKCPNCNTGFVEELVIYEPGQGDGDSDMDSEDGNMEPPPSERNRRPTISVFSQENNFEALIQDFIQNLSPVGWRAQGVPGRLDHPLTFVLENPGDYAWGREGLDTVVTHLLNQMDGNGPPPLTKEKIKEIPVVNILRDQVEKSLQCSVCWEDFQLGEPVRKLGCEHVYHENCIIPWLELHGTCPICRKTLHDDSREMQQDEDDQIVQDISSLREGLALLIRAAQNPNTSATIRISAPENPSTSTGSSGSDRSDQNSDSHLTDLE